MSELSTKGAVRARGIGPGQGLRVFRASSLRALMQGIRPILEMSPDFMQPVIDDGSWTAVVGDHTPWPLKEGSIIPLVLPEAGPRWAWTPLLNPNDEFEGQGHLVGVSGTIVHAEMSASDNPYLHPFGTDWECWIAVDAGRGFEKLLAHSNKGDFRSPASVVEGGGDYGRATAIAREWLKTPDGLGLAVPDEPAHAGVVGVEWDQDEVPEEFRPKEKDRIAVFGRLIVDMGHDDFHTEIHPPLLLAGARAVQSTTRSTLTSRPYLVSQDYCVTPGTQESDGATLEHMLREIHKIAIFASSQIEMHPIIHPKPFKGHQTMQYLLRAPALPPGTAAPGSLTVSYCLVARTGVTVQMAQLAADTIAVTVSMEEAQYHPVAPPGVHHPEIDPATTELGAATAYLIKEGPAALNALAAYFALGPIVGGMAALHDIWGQNQDWKTDRYDRPMMSSLPGKPVTVLGADVAHQAIQVVYDDGQPWPVYGWINVAWGTPQSGLLSARAELVDSSHWRVEAVDRISGQAVPGVEVLVNGKVVGEAGKVLSPRPVAASRIGPGKLGNIMVDYPSGGVRAPLYDPGWLDLSQVAVAPIAD